MIIGVVIGAFVASFSTGATGATSHRNNVTGDVVLRNYAEAAKTAARSCTTGRTFTIAYPASGLPLPARYTRLVHSVARDVPGPGRRTPVTPVTLTVTLPSNLQRSLVVEVRTP